MFKKVRPARPQPFLLSLHHLIVPFSGASIATAAWKKQHEMLHLQEILFAIRTRGTHHAYKEYRGLVSRSLGEGWRIFSTFPEVNTIGSAIHLNWGLVKESDDSILSERNEEEMMVARK